MLRIRITGKSTPSTPQRIYTGTSIPGRLFIDNEEEREIYREFKKKRTISQ